MNLKYFIIIILTFVLLFIMLKLYDTLNITKSEQFTITENDIISKYNMDISMLRNLAQLSQKSLDLYNNTLTLPINNTTFNDVDGNDNITVNNLIIDSTKNINLIYSTSQDSLETTIDSFYPYMIIAWSGPNNMIPHGWKICDGKQYVKINDIYTNYNDLTDHNKIIYNDKKIILPNLTGRFIMSFNADDYISTNNTYSQDDIDINPYDFFNTKPIGKHTLNEIGGNNMVMLNFINIPPHKHHFNLRADPNNPGTKFNYNSVNYTPIDIGKAYDDAFNNPPSVPPGLPEPTNSDYRIDLSNVGKLIMDSVNSRPKTLAPDECTMKIYTGTNLMQLNNGIITSTDQEPYDNMPPYAKLYYIMKMP